MRKFEIAKGFEDKDIILPTRATEGSAGYDIRVITENKETVKIFPNSSKLFHTGIKVYMEEDEVLQIYVRSSIGIKKRLTLANGTGIIDSSYVDNPTNDGEIMIMLVNNSDQVVTVEHNERVAQGIFIKYLTVNGDATTGVRLGGIGSTNVAA